MVVFLFLHATYRASSGLVSVTRIDRQGRRCERLDTPLDEEDGERSRKLPASTTASPTKKVNPYATAVDIGDFVTNEEFTNKLGKRTAQELLFLVQLQVRCSSAYFPAGCVVTTMVVVGLAVGRPHPDGDHCDWHHRPGWWPGPLPTYAETGTVAPCRRGVAPSGRHDMT